VDKEREELKKQIEKQSVPYEIVRNKVIDVDNWKVSAERKELVDKKGNQLYSSVNIKKEVIDNQENSSNIGAKEQIDKEDMSKNKNVGKEEEKEKKSDGKKLSEKTRG